MLANYTSWRDDMFESMAAKGKSVWSRTPEELYDEIVAQADARIPRYTVVWCFAGTALAVAELTYDEAWTARDLHSVAGHTAWVEAEA